jgi:hypothetical protein
MSTTIPSRTQPPAAGHRRIWRVIAYDRLIRSRQVYQIKPRRLIARQNNITNLWQSARQQLRINRLETYLQEERWLKQTNWRARSSSSGAGPNPEAHLAEAGQWLLTSILICKSLHHPSS